LTSMQVLWDKNSYLRASVKAPEAICPLGQLLALHLLWKKRKKSS
jgi:hypothetical protein